MLIDGKEYRIESRFNIGDKVFFIELDETTEEDKIFELPIDEIFYRVRKHDMFGYRTEVRYGFYTSKVFFSLTHKKWGYSQVVYKDEFDVFSSLEEMEIHYRAVQSKHGGDNYDNWSHSPVFHLFPDSNYVYPPQFTLK